MLHAWSNIEIDLTEVDKQIWANHCQSPSIHISIDPYKPQMQTVSVAQIIGLEDNNTHPIAEDAEQKIITNKKMMCPFICDRMTGLLFDTKTLFICW